MFKKATNRSWPWEILNSLWILFSFIACGFIAFLFIGRKAMKRKWTICGFIYMVLLLGIPTFMYELSLPNWLFDVWMIIWLISIIHSFIVRKEYLISRDIILNADLEGKRERQLKNRIADEYRKQGIINSAEADYKEKIENIVNAKRDETDKKASAKLQKRTESKTEEVKTKVQEKSVNETAQSLDINNCSMEELEALAGISAVAAKKADAYRKEHQGFHSVDEFFEVTQLKPHFVVQLEGNIVCGTYKTQKKSVDDRRRVLDL